MCLCFWVFSDSPVLLLAFNRDEYFDRPTAELHRWNDGSGIIAGRDLEGQGTWLGISARTNRVAWLTNLRSADPIEPSALTRRHASRGELPTRFLTGTQTPLEFVQSLDPEHYHGYNLVVGDLRTRSFAYSNNGGGLVDGPAPPAGSGGGAGAAREGGCGLGSGGGGDGGGGRWSDVRELSPGVVYGLSNGTLMEWPKVTTGVQLLRELLPSITPDRPVPWGRLFEELLGDSRRLVPPAGAAAGRPPGAEAAEGVRAPTAEEERGAAAEEERGLAASVAAGAAGRPCAVAAGSGMQGLAGRGCEGVSEGPLAAVTDGAAGAQDSGGGGESCCAGTHDAGGARATGGAGAGAPGSGGDAGAGTADGGVECAANGGEGEAAYFVAELEHITSGRFVPEVQSPYGLYGTRSQTAILVWRDGTGEARERFRCADGTWKEAAVQFQMEGWQDI